MTDITKGLKKACPICDKMNVANKAQILPSRDIIYRFLCSYCGHPYRMRVRGPNLTVEPLKGFRFTMRWEP